jgi:hypothetical protein
MRNKDMPYYAQINFTIDVFPFLQDGSLDPDKLTESELRDLDINKSAVFGINGYTLDDCIKKIVEALSKISYEEN